MIVAKEFVPNCWRLLDGEQVVGLVVPHPHGGWHIVDGGGKPLSTGHFSTPQLAALYFPGLSGDGPSARNPA